MEMMTHGKEVGLEDISVEVRKCLGEKAVEFLTKEFNMILASEKMPEEWRKSLVVPIFRNKGYVQCCSNEKWDKAMQYSFGEEKWE